MCSSVNSYFVWSRKCTPGQFLIDSTAPAVMEEGGISNDLLNLFLNQIPLQVYYIVKVSTSDMYPWSIFY